MNTYFANAIGPKGESIPMVFCSRSCRGICGMEVALTDHREYPAYPNDQCEVCGISIGQ
jgi:hypothetical protein